MHFSQEVNLGDGDTVTAMCPSQDGGMLAVQRSTAFLQFVHITSANMFVQVLPQTCARRPWCCCHLSTLPA